MKFILLLFISFISSQGLNIYLNEKEKNKYEIESIQKNIDKEELFLFPIVNKQKKTSFKKNIFFKQNSNNLSLEPVLAFRYSNAAFEIDSRNLPCETIWITPGFHFEGQTPIFYNFTSTWIYYWADFYKHAAYGFNGDKIEHGKKLFTYNPLYSIQYYEPVDESFNGIEFDEGQGGVALIAPNFNVLIGKLKTNLGPFSRDNLSISKSSPSFQQFRIYKKITNGKKQIHFTYILGFLYSEIIDSTIFNNYYIDTNKNSRRPNVPRYVALHRIDLNIKSNFRIGLYEEIIFGARDIPLEYINPVIPFWSAQHSLGDLDNLILGLDFTYIYKRIRFIGAFFIDEWDPYKTFNKKNNRNWFGYQFGFSFLPISFNNKLLFKTEYAKLDPRVYNHRFEINYPQHHNYNLGYWTGGHAEDIWISLMYYLNDKSVINLSYEKTQIGEQNVSNQYNDIDIPFLSGEIKHREVYSLSYSKNILKYIDFTFNLKSFDTSNLDYKSKNFLETSFSFLYNMPY